MDSFQHPAQPFYTHPEVHRIDGLLYQLANESYDFAQLYNRVHEAVCIVCEAVDKVSYYNIRY